MSSVAIEPKMVKVFSWGSAASMEVMIHDVVGELPMSSLVRLEPIGAKDSMTKGDRRTSHVEISTSPTRVKARMCLDLCQCSDTTENPSIGCTVIHQRGLV